MLNGTGTGRPGNGARRTDRFAAEVAALAALADDHDARIVQHRRARQRTVRAQDAHARQRRRVVAFVGASARSSAISARAAPAAVTAMRDVVMALIALGKNQRNRPYSSQALRLVCMP
jgi:hypothetical protein